ncbi:MAG: alcohol dehydrogenase catalytic domain-containing protein [Terriglobales bacterium]
MHEAKPHPTIQDRGDAIVRVTTSTICGTDLHILKGDLPAVTWADSRPRRRWHSRRDRERCQHKLAGTNRRPLREKNSGLSESMLRHRKQTARTSSLDRN